MYNDSTVSSFWSDWSERDYTEREEPWEEEEGGDNFRYKIPDGCRDGAETVDGDREGDGDRVAGQIS